LRGCVVELWQWVVEKICSQGEVEFDLKAFNRYVKKRRGIPYDPKTLKLAAKKLHEVGAIEDIGLDGRGRNKFKWNWRRWIVKPIDSLIDPPKPKLKPRRECSPQQNANSEKNAPTPQSVDDEVKSSSSSFNDANSFAKKPIDELPENADEILAECEAAGIPFVKAECPKVLEFPLHQVKMALAYFLYRFPNEESRREIRSLQGLLIFFLRRKCWNWNRNFLGNLCAYKLVPDWIFNLCTTDGTLQTI
jgi:hypothetical protein